MKYQMCNNDIYGNNMSVKHQSDEFNCKAKIS